MNDENNIAYTKAFLQSIGIEPVDSLWRKRGKIVRCIENTDIVSVLWEDGEIANIHKSNLCEVGSAAYSVIDAKGWMGWGTGFKKKIY